jgi:ribose/xylose/arabinose/galactoside ABC-type transport system permease subunit
VFLAQLYFHKKGILGIVKQFNRLLPRFLSKYAIYLVLVIMIVVMSIIKPENFPTWANFRNILRQMTTIGIMALGVTFVIITGGTDLSGGSLVALCSVVCAKLVCLNQNREYGIPLAAAILITILIGSLGGFVNGVLAAYGKVPPFIGTLGMMWVARGIANLLSDSRPISGFNDAFNFIGGGLVAWGIIPMPVIVFFLCSVVAYVLLHWTKFGTYVYAVGSNEVAAHVSGTNVKRVKMFTYIIAGAFAAIAAIIITSRQQSGQPGMGSGYEMEAITCAIIGGASFSGGIGTIPGTVVGSLIMGVIANSMTMLQINPNWQMVIKGAIVALAVLFDTHKQRKTK